MAEVTVKNPASLQGKVLTYLLLNKVTRKVIDNMGSLSTVEDGVKTRTVFDEVKASVEQPIVKKK